jgi:ornithine cyclodeaminase/alanine dehydrogenase-like protein (mu-crystallin family)
MLYLDAEALAARLGRGSLIDALDRAFRCEIQMPARQSYAVGDSVNPAALMIMPAWQTNASIGVKLVTVFPNNSVHGKPAVHATYTLFDATTGAPRAMLDGTELTLRRTAATSALAARYLAIPEAARLLMVGTGSMALHVIESHAAVRPIRSVRVWGRRPERAIALAKGFAGKPFDIEAVEDLQAAVSWADIISCATLATTPLVRGAWLRPGQHLDLIGSFTPHMREADDEAMTRAAIYVDTRAGALAESGELVQALATGLLSSADIRGELSELARGSISGRRESGQITLFKSVGCALEDLAAAELAVSGGCETTAARVTRPQ